MLVVSVRPKTETSLSKTKLNSFLAYIPNSVATI